MKAEKVYSEPSLERDQLEGETPSLLSLIKEKKKRKKNPDLNLVE